MPPPRGKRRIRHKSPDMVLNRVEIVVNFPSLVFYLYLIASMLVLLAELAGLTTVDQVFLYMYLNSVSASVAVIAPLPLPDPNRHQSHPILTLFTLFGKLPSELRREIVILSLRSGVDLSGITFSLLPHDIEENPEENEDGNIDFFNGSLDVTFPRERLEPFPAALTINKEFRAEAVRLWNPVRTLRSLPQIYEEANYLKRPIWYDQSLHTCFVKFDLGFTTWASINFKEFDEEHPTFLANLDVLEVRDIHWIPTSAREIFSKRHRSRGPGPLKFCRNLKELRLVRKKDGGKWEDKQVATDSCTRAFNKYFKYRQAKEGKIRSRTIPKITLLNHPERR